MSRPQAIRGSDDSTKPATTKPIEIRSDRRGAGEKGRAMAQSCPVFRPPPPPPPSTRPQIPSVEPPPLDLPPSPSTFSDELKEPSPSTGAAPMGVAVGGRAATNSAQAHRNIARSLMLSSSLPTSSFLDSYKWQAVDENSADSPALYDEDKDGDDADADGEHKLESPTGDRDSTASPPQTRPKSSSITGRARGPSVADETTPGSLSSSISRRPITIASHHGGAAGSGSGADDLSKSPTVLSLLQSNSFTNSPQVQYRSSRATHMDTRATVLAKNKPPKDEDDEDETPDDNANDDLQFSISLNENDESYLDGGDEVF